MVTLPFLGSRSRLIWLRLVFMRSARRLRERFCVFIASAICHARTSLMATASNSSSLPSSFSKSSSVASLAVEREIFFLFMPISSRGKFAPAPARKCQVFVRRLSGLLDEAVKNQDSALTDAKQNSGDSAPGKITSDFPQPLTHRTAERHPDRPSVLNPHEILSDDIAVRLI